MEYRIVLAVDRHDLGAACARGAHEQRPGHDQGFLVGEQQPLARARGGERRGETGGADDRRHHHAALVVRRHALQGRGAEKKLGARFGELRAQHPVFSEAGEHRVARPVDPAKREQCIRGAVRGKGEDAIALAVAREDV